VYSFMRSAPTGTACGGFFIWYGETMKTRFPLLHWRQQVALDVGTSTIRAASGLRPLIEQHSRLGSRSGMRGGVVIDPATVAEILRPILDSTRLFGIVKPCVLACAPSDATQEERQRLHDAVMQAGASSVMIIPEPLAAAVGAGIDVSSPYAQMVVDIGEGVTECALIRMSRIQTTAAVRVGCGQMRAGLQPALTQQSGNLHDRHGEVSGHSLPMAIHPALETITELIDDFLQNLSPETGCEVIENGILLTGGGALIPGLSRYLEHHSGISVITAPQPRYNVVEGARAILPVVVMLNLLT